MMSRMFTTTRIFRKISKNRMIKNMVRVLGIDPGLASLGWGVVHMDGARIFYGAHGYIQTKPAMDMGARLSFIRDEVQKIITSQKPDEIAMEDLFFAKNVTSGLAVAEVRGILRLVAHDANLVMREYKPVTVKQAVTGSGRANKGDVQAFVKILLGLSSIPKPDHAADALAVAICHCQFRSTFYKAPLAQIGEST